MTAALAPRTGLTGRMLDQGYIPPADATFPELLGSLEIAELIVEASPWWVVDVVAELERRFPHEYHQMLPEAEHGIEGVRKAKLKQAGWMADCWPRGTRVPGISFTHHRIVRKMAADDRAAAVSLLEAARDAKDADGNASPWSTRELAREVEARARAIPADMSEAPVCAADRPEPLGLDDLLPEWQDRAYAHGQPGYADGYLQALIDSGAEACFARWID